MCQPESPYTKCVDCGGSKERFQYGNQDNTSAAASKGRCTEVFSRAKSNECQCNVGEEIHAFNDVFRHEIQAVRTEQNPGNDIGRNAGQMQQLGQPGHGKAAEQHQSDRENELRYRRGDTQYIIKTGHFVSLLFQKCLAVCVIL